MFQSRTFVTIGIALLLAFGAVYVANNWLMRRITPDSHAGMVPVAVATHEIPFGRKVDLTDVHLVHMPPDAIPQGTFPALEQAVGRVATQTIFSGEILRTERVVEFLGGSALAAVISPEKRAITVRVNDVIGVAGFLLPGNIVDVLASRKGDGHHNEIQTRTLLTNLRVLAVDQTASPDKDQPVIVRAVTMEMTPREAEQLFQATQEGSVQLALRNPLDRSEAPKLAEVEPPKPAPVAKPRKVAAPPTVTIIKGTQVTTERL